MVFQNDTKKQLLIDPKNVCNYRIFSVKLLSNVLIKIYQIKIRLWIARDREYPTSDQKTGSRVSSENNADHDTEVCACTFQRPQQIDFVIRAHDIRYAIGLEQSFRLQRPASQSRR
jgi:hypothetical protein